MNNILVFDIETIPDAEAGRKLYDMGDDIDPVDITKAMNFLQLQKTGGEFQPLHLHKIVQISVALYKHPSEFKLWSLGTSNTDESELLTRFFQGMEQYTPQLVSWNGMGFDMPVIRYRSLLHGITSRLYWESGNEDSNFKWNNYLNRYHERHLDLADVLANFSGRMSKLNEVSVLLGLPGKIGVGAENVWKSFYNGEMTEISNYCEIDVLNTFLIFLRFQLIRNELSEKEYQSSVAMVANYIENSNEKHLEYFLQEWKKSSPSHF